MSPSFSSKRIKSSESPEQPLQQNWPKIKPALSRNSINLFPSKIYRLNAGAGIRTQEGADVPPVLKTGTFNHSVTPANLGFASDRENSYEFPISGTNFQKFDHQEPFVEALSELSENRI